MSELFIVESEKAGIRFDEFLSEKSGKTRSYIKTLIESGKAILNGNSVKAGKTIKAGDKAEIEDLSPVESKIQAIDIPISIVYQDDDIAVINKPQGLVVHAGNGTKGATLVNALLFHLDKLSSINGIIRPGIVHRIDKDTSGLLVVAKNDNAHLSLSKQIQNKTCRRTYLAVLEGIVKEDAGTIETFIGRDEKNRTKMAVKNSGRKAVTHFKVLKRYKSNTLCEFELETGRTHQIRVHAKYMGHPIVGDKTYGFIKQKFNLDGQLLHAAKLQLVHPVSGKEMTFTAPLPEYFEKILRKL